ncbi:MAG: hypothetical protein WD572_01380 [Gammaproteobacteria bacterium]
MHRSAREIERRWLGSGWWIGAGVQARVGQALAARNGLKLVE